MTTARCPVCDWEIKDDGIKVRVGGKEITVCCDECAKEAQARQARSCGALDGNTNTLRALSANAVRA